MRRFQRLLGLEIMVDQRAYLLEKIRRTKNQLAKLKQRNEEKEMSIFMYQIYHDGKSLSDFEPNELKRLLCYVEKMLKKVRERINQLEEAALSPNPPPPKNEIDSIINTNDKF